MLRSDRSAVPVNPRSFPLVGRNGKISIPRGFNFYQAMATIEQWLPKINPSRCDRNCGIASENTVRSLFGQPLEAAPPGDPRGWTDADMENRLGPRFNSAPVPDDVALNNALSRLPECTVGVVSATNRAYSGRTPPGRLTSASHVPGHFFVFVKLNGEVQYWDGQTGKAMVALSNNWYFRYMVVGNPLRP